MRTGTSHFRTFADAVQYYKPYGFDRAAVGHKRATGEITIGPPSAKQGEKVTIDADGRYWLEG